MFRRCNSKELFFLQRKTYFLRIMLEKKIMNMEIATNFKAVKFRLTQSQSIGQHIIAHLNAIFWLQQLSKLLIG